MYIPSLENFKHRPPEALFIPLTNLAGELRGTREGDPERKRVLSEISKLLQSAVGLKFNLHDVPSQTAYITYPVFNTQHPHLVREKHPPVFTKDHERYIAKYMKKGFTYDESKGKFAGAISEVPAAMVVGVNHLFDKYNFTDRMFAAAILHETGHYVNIMLFIHKVNLSNQVLEEASRLKGGDEAKVKYIAEKYLTAEEKSDMKKVDLRGQKLRVISAMLENIQTRKPTRLESLQHRRNDESFADEFAISHGAGEDLYKVLEAVDAPNNWTLYLTLMVVVGWYIASLGMLITGPLGILIYGALYNILGNLALILVFYPGKEFGAYGTSQSRRIRLYNNMVNRLKTADLNNEDKSKLIESLIRQRKIDEAFVTDDGGIIPTIYRIFSKKIHQARTIQHEETLLEGMINNDLFITQARFQIEGEKK